jgi:hypothetical protein
MVQPGTERFKGQRKVVTRTGKGKIVGRKKAMEMFHPSTCTKQKQF